MDADTQNLLLQAADEITVMNGELAVLRAKQEAYDFCAMLLNTRPAYRTECASEDMRQKIARHIIGKHQAEQAKKDADSITLKNAPAGGVGSGTIEDSVCPHGKKEFECCEDCATGPVIK